MESSSVTDFEETAYLEQDDLPVVFPSAVLGWPAEYPPRQEGSTEDSVDLVGSGSSDAEASTGWDASFTVPATRIRPLPKLAYHFDLRQHWEGTVVAVAQNEFRGILKDLTNPDTPPEEATFSTEEVFPGDLRLVVPGAVFRWSIGYKTQGGQKDRVSRVHFARLPGWSKRAVERVEAEAAELQRLFSDST